MTFGEDLKAAREAAGLTQLDVATQTGIQQKQISGYENDRVTPNYGTLEKLEAVLGVRLNVPAGDEPVTPKDVPEADGFTKDEPPKVRKPRAAGPKPKPSSGMPSLREQLEIPYRLASAGLAPRLPNTAAVIGAQAGPCAAAWDQFLLRYPKLREKIEQGAVAADIVNLVMAHMPILPMAREEIAAQQAQTFPTEGQQAA